MTLIVWPRSLAPRHVELVKRGRSISGSTSLSGITQAIASDAGLWVATVTEFPVVTRDRIKLWRALEGLINGRVNAIRFPILDLDRRPEPRGTEEVPHSDLSIFDDGTQYEQSLFDAEVTDDAALRASEIGITVIYGDPVEPGQFFSLGDHLYSIIADNEDGTFRIWPPLREAVTAGTAAKFDQPVCKMRLASDSEMDLDLQYGRWGFPTVRLIEDTSAE